MSRDCFISAAFSVKMDGIARLAKWFLLPYLELGRSLHLDHLVRKTPLFEPFIYRNAHFTKTGSGQTSNTNIKTVFLFSSSPRNVLSIVLSAAFSLSASSRAYLGKHERFAQETMDKTDGKGTRKQGN